MGYAIAEGTPKSKGSRRVVDVAPELVAALRTWRKHQAAERLKYGPLYADSEGLVITWEDGRRPMPEYLTKQFAKEQKASGLGLPVLRLHDTRHCYVSMLRSLGVPEYVVQEMVGHADLRMTDHYTHAHDATKRQAAELLGSAQGF